MGKKYNHRIGGLLLGLAAAFQASCMGPPPAQSYYGTAHRTPIDHRLRNWLIDSFISNSIFEAENPRYRRVSDTPPETAARVAEQIALNVLCTQEDVVLWSQNFDPNSFCINMGQRASSLEVPGGMHFDICTSKNESQQIKEGTELIRKYFDILQRYPEGVKFHINSRALKPNLFFDRKGNMGMQGFLFDPYDNKILSFD